VTSGAPIDRGAEAARGRLVVVSGPSGVGKTAVIERLLAHPRFARAVTATTRPPRAGERDGVDYLFLAPDEFRRRLDAGWFLESADVYGRLYGTPREGPERILASGRHCLLNIDVQGAATLRAAGVEAVFVFLRSPSERELARRLRARGLDGPAEVERRLAAAERELAESRHFDLVLVNDDLGVTARNLARWVGVDLSSTD
jgi:guanylate kinase